MDPHQEADESVENRFIVATPRFVVNQSAGARCFALSRILRAVCTRQSDRRRRIDGLPSFTIFPVMMFVDE